MPPFPQLKENNVRQGFLEDSQYEKLIQDGRRNQQCKTLAKENPVRPLTIEESVD